MLDEEANKMCDEIFECCASNATQDWSNTGAVTAKESSKKNLK